MLSATDEEILQAAEQYLSLWTIKHAIKNEAGLPVEFDNHRFLLDVYDDFSPLQVLLKPPQIGATVMNILKSFYAAKRLGKDIVYTLPTATDVNDMAGGKINRLVAQNPVLKGWVKTHDTVEQKSVGDNIIYYRGTFSAKQAMMVSSDLNIHDEVDASDPAVITQYETRLQAKADGWRWYFSHPSLAGHGVDIYWQQSDKKEWYIRCPHCSREQILSWPDNIEPLLGEYVCSICHGILSPDDRKQGRWEATAQGKFSGFHVSQMMCPWISAKAILEAKNDPMKDEQYFYNYVLGLPYIESNDKITPEAVLKNVHPAVNDQAGQIVIGVDTGLPIYFTVMNKQGVFYHGTCTKGYADLEAMLTRWPRAIIVSDQGGDLIGIRELQQKYPGRVFLTYYRKDRKTAETVKWADDGSVVVDRNRMITLIVDQLRDVGRIRLNGAVDDWKPFAAHFGNITRMKEETPFGMEYKWERSGPDHYCFVAGTKVATDKGDTPIEKLKEGDRVFTRNGYQEIYHTGVTQQSVPVVSAYFSNGSHFTCTPDHPIIHTHGQTRVDSIVYGDRIYTCQRQSNTKELNTEDTQSLRDGKQQYTSLPTGLIEQKDTRGFISKYGLMPLALSLKGMSFIIKTAIRSITRYQTWCVRHELFIKDITLWSASKTVITEQDRINIWHKSGVSLTRGAKPPKGRSGTVNMLIRVLCYRLPLILSVLSAVLKQLHGAISAVSFVPPDVQIVGLHENIDPMDVINISVANSPEYFAEGILVSNCHALLYAMVGFDRFGEAEAAIISNNNWLDEIPLAKNFGL